MIWAALSIGLIGGMHCTVMCAPLMLGVFKNKARTLSFFAYQLGRIFTYMILGVLLALFGEGLSLLGWQSALSILMALLIVYFYVVPSKYKVFNKLNHWEAYPYQWLKNSFRKFLGKSDVGSRFSIGLLNGLLPCGLVYMALLSSVATETVWESAFYMLFFGLGTVPWIVASVWAGQFTFKKLNRFTANLKPVLAFTLAAFLFLRGLGVEFIHIPMPDWGQQNRGIDIPICGRD